MGTFGLGEILDHLVSRWSFIWIGGGLVLVAYLVNRFAPEKKKRIRRIVILFVLFTLAAVASAAFRVAGTEKWASGLRVAGDLLEAFTVINLVALALFDVALPALRIELVSLTSDIIVGIAYVVSTVLVLVETGINPSSVIGVSAVASVVLSLSLQSTLGNILGGLALQLDGSIHVGDWLQLDNGRQGKVSEIRWRHTALETRDWDTIIVPNATLLAQNIIILGKRTGMPVQHRMWVYFNVDFRYPPTAVIGAVREALLAAPIPNVAVSPPPNVICYDFAKDTRDSFGYYAVRYWLTDLLVDDPTNSAVRARVYAALKRAGIPLARPVSTVFFAPNDDDDKLRLDRQRDRRLKAIRCLDLFKQLTPDELDFLADHLRYAPFTAGETMTRAGAVAHWLYVVTSGTAEVRVSVDGAVKTLATIAAPGFFGEMGLMTGEPRSADVVAVTDVECYRLDKAAFEQIVVERPEIAEGMSQTLAQRRVELLAARDGLDADARKKKEESERRRILERIQSFFGLKG